MPTTPQETAPKSAAQLANGEVQRAGHASLEGRAGCYTAAVFGCTDERHQSHSFSTLAPARAKFAELAAL